jgi:hypothetical protein
MASRLIWHGDEIKSRVEASIADAMNATLADAVAQAQQPGWTPRDTGTLANSITFEGVKRDGNGWLGSFGSYDVHYAIYVEIGTYKMAGRFYLRRAADAIFPTLPGRIAEMLR